MWQMCEEQRFAGRLKLLEYRDRSCGGLADYPGRRGAGGIAFTLERETGDLPPIGPSLGILLGRQAPATQVFDYWWSVRIPDVCYSHADCGAQLPTARGPGHSQRKPVCIAPYVEGPDGAPFVGPNTRCTCGGLIRPRRRCPADCRVSSSVAESHD